MCVCVKHHFKTSFQIAFLLFCESHLGYFFFGGVSHDKFQTGSNGKRHVSTTPVKIVWEWNIWIVEICCNHRFVWLARISTTESEWCSTIYIYICELSATIHFCFDNKKEQHSQTLYTEPKTGKNQPVNTIWLWFISGFLAQVCFFICAVLAIGLDLSRHSLVYSQIYDLRMGHKKAFYINRFKWLPNWLFHWFTNNIYQAYACHIALWLPVYACL